MFKVDSIHFFRHIVYLFVIFAYKQMHIGLQHTNTNYVEMKK